MYRYDVEALQEKYEQLFESEKVKAKAFDQIARNF